jgi:hypothetical protein
VELEVEDEDEDDEDDDEVVVNRVDVDERVDEEVDNRDVLLRDECSCDDIKATASQLGRCREC